MLRIIFKERNELIKGKIMTVEISTLKKIINLVHLPVLAFDREGDVNLISPQAKEKLSLGDMGLKNISELKSDKPELSSLLKLIHEIKDTDLTSIEGGAWHLYAQKNGELICIADIESGYWQDQIAKSSRVIEDHKRALDQSSIVAITDAKGVITYVNDTFCRISEYSREELIGKTHRLINSKYHPKEFFMDLWKTVGSGQVWKGHVKNKAKSGKEYWVNTTIVPFIDERGRPYQYMAIRQDVTEQMQVKEALEKQRTVNMHAEKMVSLGEMAAGIAHELGNPAASIQAWLDVIESHLLRGEVDMDRFLKTLPKVRADATRMKDIIKGMLTYARDGSKDPFMSESLVNLIQLVQDYCAFKFRKMNIEFSYEIANPYLEIDCRLSEMTQVFVNLIINACDAIKDLDDRWIKVNVEDEGSEVKISITDSGHGISEEIREKIFNPFFTTKPVGQGTGLGLSIVSSLINSHNGSLAIDDSQSHTCFVLRLLKKQKFEES